MAFAGVANAKDRADLIAYLKTKWSEDLVNFANKIELNHWIILFFC